MRILTAKRDHQSVAELGNRPPVRPLLHGNEWSSRDVDIVNDDVVPATKSRCDAYIHVFCDLLPGKVACDYGPFAQSRIDYLIQLRNGKVAGSFGADIIECHKPVVANGAHNLVVTVPEMVDDLTPSDESARVCSSEPLFPDRHRPKHWP